MSVRLGSPPETPGGSETDAVALFEGLPGGEERAPGFVRPALRAGSLHPGPYQSQLLPIHRVVTVVSAMDEQPDELHAATPNL
jgi:hypothetical protein